MHNNSNNPIVIIRCWTFNHGQYIRECLDGFVMQKTDFPFAAIVVDDASTDNEPDLLWDFINKELESSTAQRDETEDYVRVTATHKTNHNCMFVFFFLKYNHYSIKKNKRQYLKEWEDNAKYIAGCEGDDYWTDPLKLQKQIGFLESHPDFTMTCHRIQCYSQTSQKIIREEYCYNKSRKIKTKDIIYRTGFFIPTCSIVIRKSVLDNYPEYCSKCMVGDYPLQIMCAMKGNTYYFNEVMGVYRVDNGSSWTGSQDWCVYSERRVKVIRSQINMFRGFAKDYPKWRKYFHNKEVDQILRHIPCKKGTPVEDQKKYFAAFSEEINNLSLFEKIDMKIRMSTYYSFKTLYFKYILSKYSRKYMWY